MNQARCITAKTATQSYDTNRTFFSVAAKNNWRLSACPSLQCPIQTGFDQFTKKLLAQNLWKLCLGRTQKN